MEKACYFAYGSNMNPSRMRERGVKFLSYKRAVLKDFVLTFDKVCRTFPPSFGCATVRPFKGSVVEGILYEVDFVTAVRRLDLFEGFPDHYGRVFLKVLTSEGKTLSAFLYVARPERIREELKPHPEYLTHLLEACRLGLLSEGYCRFLKKWKS